jgi:hypothetical protein
VTVQTVTHLVDYWNAETVELLEALLKRAKRGQRIEFAGAIRVDGRQRCYLTGSFKTQGGLVALAAKELWDRAEPGEDSGIHPPLAK